MHIEAKLRKLGLELPEVKKPAGLYVFTKRVGNLVYVSGQTPDIGSILQYKGVVGEDMSIETAQQAAQLAALNILAVLKLDLGDLDRIRQIVQVVGYVRCAKGFEDQPKVINGASQVFKDLWGDAGIAARLALGTNGGSGISPLALTLYEASCISAGRFCSVNEIKEEFSPVQFD